MEPAIATPWAPASISTYDKNDIVVLLVGREEKELRAHKAYLSRHSEFLQATIRRKWVEGEPLTIKLPREEPAIVKQYLDFIYGDRLPTDSTRNDSRRGRVFGVLAQLFALAEHLQDTALRNAIIREMVRFSTVADGAATYVPILEDVRIIYDCTTGASPARRLMVAFYARGRPTWITRHAHPEFAQDLATSLLSNLWTIGHPLPLVAIEAGDFLL